MKNQNNLNPGKLPPIVIVDDSLSPEGWFIIWHKVSMPIECSVTIVWEKATYPIKSLIYRENEIAWKIDEYASLLWATKISERNNLMAYSMKDTSWDSESSTTWEGVLIEKKNWEINLYPMEYYIHCA
jgi:hypothetical protein